MWRDVGKKEMDTYLNDASQCLDKRVSILSDEIFDHHQARSTKFPISSIPQREKVEVFRQVTVEAMHEYFDTFYDQMWPGLISTIAGKFKPPSRVRCTFCGCSWEQYGCDQHSLFKCQYVDPCCKMSFDWHGPGTSTNIQCNLDAWCGCVRKMACNPFQRLTGIEVRIRVAYLDAVVWRYQQWPIDFALDRDRLCDIAQVHWRIILKEYKREGRSHCFGEAPRR